MMMALHAGVKDIDKVGGKQGGYYRWAAFAATLTDRRVSAPICSKGQNISALIHHLDHHYH